MYLQLGCVIVRRHAPVPEKHEHAPFGASPASPAAAPRLKVCRLLDSKSSNTAARIAKFKDQVFVTMHRSGVSPSHVRAGLSCVQQATRQHMYAFYWMLLAMNTGIRYFDTAKGFYVPYTSVCMLGPCMFCAGRYIQTKMPAMVGAVTYTWYASMNGSDGRTRTCACFG